MPGVPPVPIPNTAVKPRAADGSRTLGPARVGCCQVYGPDVAKAASGPFFLPFAEGRCAAWFVDDTAGLKATLATAGR